MRMDRDFQVKKWVGDMPGKIGPGPWKTHEKTVRAVSSLVCYSAVFPDPADDMLISTEDTC